MKNIKILFFLTLSFMLTSNAFASTIDKIDVVDNNTVEITASNDVNFSKDYVEGDVKILKDINVSYSSKDENNAKKVVLNLGSDLEANTSYSLITILGAEGNIDFEIGDNLKGEIINKLLLNGDEGIEKINIIDSRTLELYFTSDLKEDMFEFKLLSDIPVSRLSSEGNNILNVEITNNLEKETDYILMILSLEDKDGNVLVFDEDLYDFSTSSDLVIDAEPKEVVLASAKEDVKVVDKGNVAEVALAKAETPDTGAATWVLIALAAIVNLGFLLRKKILN